ncbi:MAG: hypothetical protein AAF567_06920 [Actinomycetota bacterium]
MDIFRRWRRRWRAASAREQQPRSLRAPRRAAVVALTILLATACSGTDNATLVVDADPVLAQTPTATPAEPENIQSSLESCADFAAAGPEARAGVATDLRDGVDKLTYVCSFHSIDTISQAKGWLIGFGYSQTPMPFYGPPAEVLSGRYILAYTCTDGLNLYAHNLETDITQQVADFDSPERTHDPFACDGFPDEGGNKILSSFSPDFNQVVARSNSLILLHNNNRIQWIENDLDTGQFDVPELFNDAYFTRDGAIRTTLIDNGHQLVEIHPRFGSTITPISEPGHPNCRTLMLELPEIWPLCTDGGRFHAFTEAQPVFLIPDPRDDIIKIARGIAPYEELVIRYVDGAEGISNGTPVMLADDFFVLRRRLITIDERAGTATVQPLLPDSNRLRWQHFYDEATATLYFTTDPYTSDAAFWSFQLNDDAAEPQRVEGLGNSIPATEARRLRPFAVVEFDDLSSS